MSANTLTAVPVTTDQRQYAELLAWPFPHEPFFAAQIPRLLATSIPLRADEPSKCSVWVFYDETANAVGLGTLHFCGEYLEQSGGLPHTYIPVLAVHPEHEGKGYGKRIVEYLIAEATRIVRETVGVSSYLFLDVYVANARAIGLYEKFGFAALNPDDPLVDPEQNGESYIVMAKLLSPPAPSLPTTSQP